MEVEPPSVSIRMERWKILPGNGSKKRTGGLIQVGRRTFFQNILIRYRGFVWLRQNYNYSLNYTRYTWYIEPILCSYFFS